MLKKKGPLNDTERNQMDKHAEYGHQILAASPRLKMGADITPCHHEEWDGSSYPNSIGGEQIPLSARIVQLVDIYDALRSLRPHKPAFNDAKAVNILTQGDDRIDPTVHFDSIIVQLFTDKHKESDWI